jgi:hypothetical protein
MLRPFVLDREVKAECDAKFAKSANEAEHLHTYVDLLEGFADIPGPKRHQTDNLVDTRSNMEIAEVVH